jgi:hypothetical protein
MNKAGKAEGVNFSMQIFAAQKGLSRKEKRPGVSANPRIPQRLASRSGF